MGSLAQMVALAAMLKTRDEARLHSQKAQVARLRDAIDRLRLTSPGRDISGYQSSGAAEAWEKWSHAEITRLNTELAARMAQLDYASSQFRASFQRQIALEAVHCDEKREEKAQHQRQQFEALLALRQKK